MKPLKAASIIASAMIVIGAHCRSALGVTLPVGGILRAD